MRIRKVITGTPDDFFTVAGLLGVQLFRGQGLPILVMDWPKMRAVRLQAAGKRGHVQPIPRGDGGTELVVSAQDADWLDLEPVWLTLWAELQRLGYAPAQAKDSGHYKYAPEKRRAIALEYRQGHDAGTITNKGIWAGQYDISSKTLLKYEDELDAWKRKKLEA